MNINTLFKTSFYIISILIFSNHNIYGQNNKEAKDDTLNVNYSNYLGNGKTENIEEEYKFDLTMEYETSYTNSNKISAKTYLFLSNSNPEISLMSDRKDDSVKIIFDYQNKIFIILENSELLGKKGISFPIEQLDKFSKNKGSFYDAMKHAKKTNNKSIINNLECEEYKFESDTSVVLFYKNSKIENVKFGSSSHITLTKHNLNLEGHIIKLISSDKITKENLVMELKKVDLQYTKIKSTEYSFINNSILGEISEMMLTDNSEPIFEIQDSEYGFWDEKDSKFGFVKDENGTLKVVEPYQYDEFMTTGLSHISLVRKNENWAIYHHKKAAFISPFKYIYGKQFSSERFGVTKESGLICLIDSSGKEVTNDMYIGIGEYSFNADRINVANENGKWGLADKYNNLMGPFDYDIISAFQEGDNCTTAMKGEFWGLIDLNGKPLTPFNFKYIQNYQFPIAYKSATKDNILFGLIDKNGNTIIPFEYEQINEPGEYISVKKNNLWGVINVKNEIILPFKYESLLNYSEGLIPVLKNKKWGFIDINSKTIIPFIYDEVNTFSNGEAYVKIKEKYFSIDKNGKCVSECE